MFARPLRWLPVLLVLLFAGPEDAFAHGAGWQLVDSNTTVRYRFGYTDGSPMAFAEIVITAPDGKIWQKARTDRTGHFAFAVDPASETDGPAGKWHLKVADGMGHIVQLSHQPDSAPNPEQTEHASSNAMQGTSALFDLPLWADILFGLSLLANLFGGLLIWRQHAWKKLSMHEQ
ncbi:carboxypeptidase-like regulatory domain-containing protein [Thalassospira sp. CH_XMU1448-2]|uniref:carboxypeptidase-like regulatory domain-containing protein n=1 Tax=Thalassospira sp. CH_XMU1448-2 TaxID=3107773 RepID=UPI00300999FD